ncbi:hypothetical protein BJV82DRAFT_712363 [Fennellomyces sp. T-0311]|nr:hypothetical protein BJV82DRAFT_712363 [Fennellomyces sp. T-0311]
MGESELRLQHHLWRKRVAKGFSAVASGNNKDIIGRSTESLDELMEKHVLPLLNIRSTAYEKEGMLSRALEDAMCMIQYVPTSASGYLRAGSIHRTNGWADTAVDNFKQGLKTVSRYHPQYHEMQKEHDKAVYRAQSHFDIVPNLPLDVLYKVLVCLDIERVWICLTVSQRWCKQISQCGTWWNSVIVTQTGTDLDQAVCNAIPLVKNRIQHLKFTNSSSLDLNRRYLAHLKSGAFTNIKTLSLKEGFFQTMEAEEFAIILWQIRNTLTSLKLVFGPSKSYNLLTVLAICPNLEELFYTTPGDITFTDKNENYVSGVVCKKLMNLELFYGGTNYNVLCSHIALCPNLRRLILMSSSAQPLGDPGNTTFTTYCPKLKILGLNCTEGLPVMNVSKLTADKSGVAYMSIEFNHHFIWYESARHIEAQSHSIQQLRIAHMEVHDQFRDSYYGPHPSLCTYDKLRVIRYASYRPSSIDTSFVSTIMQNSPSLSELSLSCPYGTTQLRSVFEQSVQKQIQTLTLNAVSFQKTTISWYKNLLSSLWRVQTLALGDCIFLDDNALSSLAESKSVQHLIIADCMNISDAGLTEFFKKIALKRSHQLNILELDNVSASLTISAIRFLVKIKSLRTLSIIDCTIDPDTVNGLIGLAPYSTLKTIEIFDCFPAEVAATWADLVYTLKRNGITLVIE